MRRSNSLCWTHSWKSFCCIAFNNLFEKRCGCFPHLRHSLGVFGLFIFVSQIDNDTTMVCQRVHHMQQSLLVLTSVWISIFFQESTPLNDIVAFTRSTSKGIKLIRCLCWGRVHSLHTISVQILQRADVVSR